MKNTNWMREMSWTEFEERKKTCDTVIIPAGAIEVYGPQLPLGSDSIVSKAICELVAEKVNAIIGPFIEVGESSPLSQFPGTIKILPETYALIMRDIMDSLIKWGFKNFMFINMHAGNVPIIGQLAREYQREHGIKCAQIDWWRFIQPNVVDICENTGWRAHGHASECGTSVMMYLHPEYVDESKVEYVQMDEKYTKYPEIIQYDEFRDKTYNGILGDATIATKEKGEKIVNAGVNRIVDFMNDYFEM
ncbi:MAG: creatininase family protein [Peptoniphilus harei]|nr:creatininase family protein [Peptoniphilus harei]